MAATASQTWSTAQKIRQAIGKEIDRTKKQAPDSIDIDRLKELEATMAKYRLACIETLWLDIRFAFDEKVEASLWQAHGLLNTTYRRILGKLSGAQQVVRKRRIEKLYTNFLKVSQFFYKGYIQRLCARYDMPQLRRIARSARLEEMDVPEDSRVDPTAAGIDKPVLYSCHTTLTYMGDLSRYRSLLRQHGRSFDSALTYYGLANDLLPNSGYGHHQMGLIYLEEKDHVEIVYHFYRAVALERPHPNAANNLEIEFRDLLRPLPPRSQSPYDAFASWFVRLHAYFYQGEEFSQHAELEEEVLHRLRMALKAADFGPTLLKMVLINICAYHVAQDRIKSEWTDEGSRSCQFVLRFNIRVVHAITRVIQDELVDLIRIRREHADHERASEPSKADETNETTKFNAVVAGGLPLLRVYMAWLCSHRSDLVQFQDHLEPHIGDMLKTLSQVLTGLLELLSDDADFTKVVPYLLPEDVESLGLECLHGHDLDPHCRLSVDAIHQLQKPRLEELDDQRASSTGDISFTRALDVTMCAMTLARDDLFPFALSTASVGSRSFPEVIFLEEGKQVATTGKGASVQTVDHVDPPFTTNHLAALLSNRPASPPLAIRGQPLSPTIAEPPVHTDRTSRVNSTSHTPHLHHLPGPRESLAAPETTNVEPPLESQVYEMVGEFLAPPETHGQRGLGVSGDETAMSFGINSSTARAFDAVATASSPRLGSGAPKAFPNLPWNFFHTPTPTKPNVPEGPPSRAWSGPQSPASSPIGGTANSVAMQRLGSLDGPLARGTSVQAGSPSPSGTLAAQRAQVAWEQEEYRQLRNGQPSFGGRVHHQPRPESVSSNIRAQQSSWSALGSGAALPVRGGSSGRSSWSPGAAPTEMADHFLPQMNTSWSSLVFSDNNNTLPPVNSPLGLPRYAQNSFNAPAPTGSPAFAANDRLPSTAEPPPSLGASQGILYHQGHAYTATTPYGRGQVAAADDPDYFQNFIRGTALGASAAESDAYDRRALYSALQDDYGRQ